MWSGVPQTDTPCFFGGDLPAFEGFARAWYKSHGGELPDSILYLPDFLPETAKSQETLFQRFIKDMENVVDTKAHPISNGDSWYNSPPPQANSLPLSDYLNGEVSTATYVYTFWEEIEIFFSEYQSRFHKTPFMPPPGGIHLWDKAKNVTPEEHELGLQRFHVYREWLLKEVFRVHERNPILVWPI